jgi:hypothetical protein
MREKNDHKNSAPDNEQRPDDPDRSLPYQSPFASPSLNSSHQDQSSRPPLSGSMTRSMDTPPLAADNPLDKINIVRIGSELAPAVLATQCRNRRHRLRLGPSPPLLYNRRLNSNCMCGRYSITVDQRTIEECFGAKFVSGGY